MGGGIVTGRLSANRGFNLRDIGVLANVLIVIRGAAPRNIGRMPMPQLEAEGVEPSSRGRLALASTCIGQILSRTPRRLRPNSAKYQPLLCLSE